MFKPNGDRLTLKLIESEEKTPSGIVIPDNAKEKPMWGKVVAAGKGKYGVTESIGAVTAPCRVPMEYSEGDVVCFNRYAGTEVTCDGEKYLIISESDVLGSR